MLCDGEVCTPKDSGVGGCTAASSLQVWESKAGMQEWCLSKPLFEISLEFCG